MKRIAKFIGIFLFLNVAFVIPVFFAATEDIADILKIQYVSSGATTIRVVDRSGAILRESYVNSASGSVQSARIFLPGQYDGKDLILEFSNVKCDGVKSIKKSSRLLLERSLDFLGVNNTVCAGKGIRIDGNASWRFNWGNRLFVVPLFVLELMLFFCSIIWCRCKPIKTSRDDLHKIVAVSIFGSILIGLVVPLQSYLVNRSMYGFGLSELLLQCLLMVGCCSAFTFLNLTVMNRVGKGLVTSAVLGLFIYVYFETGLFSIGLSPLNGEINTFLIRSRVIWDTLAFIALMGVSVFFKRFVLKYAHWISAAFLLLSIVSLFDLKQEKDVSFNVNTECPALNEGSREKVARSAFYSDHYNVMVFVLDMATSEVVEDVINQDEKLKTKFTGFTAYRNNVGMHMYTPPSTAGIFTGKYMEAEDEYTTYINSWFSKDSFLSSYLDHEIPLWVFPGSRETAFTNQMLDDDVSGNDTVGQISSSTSAMFMRIRDSQKWNLYEIGLLRMSPYILKSRVFCASMWGWPTDCDTWRENILYDILKDGKAKRIPMTFHYYHTAGTHEPLKLDREGHDMPMVQFGYTAHREQIWYALRNLGKLFDVYRDMGVYDKSMIVVCSDHGAAYENGGSYIKGDIPPNALPFLWVKAVGATNAFCFSVHPTSHAQIAHILEGANSEPLSQQVIEHGLYQADRIYRRVKGAELMDYHVDGMGGVRRLVKKVAQNITDLKPVPLNCYCSFSKTEQSEFDYVSSGLESDFDCPRFMGDTDGMTIKFRVADSRISYDVDLEVSLYDLGEEIDKAVGCVKVEANGCTPTELEFKGLKSIVHLKNIQPDCDGVIVISAKRINMKSSIFINRILVTKYELTSNPKRVK